MVLATLTAIGGGSDSVEPTYVDDVHFNTAVVPRSDAPDVIEEHVSSYTDLYDMSWDEAYRWYLGEDNREYGLADVEANFDSIYEGYSLIDGEVTVWVSSPAKSGGILDLLEDYDVEARVELVPDYLKPDQVAYTFVLDYGCEEYFAAELNDDETGLVILTSSQYAADAGPTLYGTMISGVPVEYRYSE